MLCVLRSLNERAYYDIKSFFFFLSALPIDNMSDNEIW